MAGHNLVLEGCSFPKKRKQIALELLIMVNVEGQNQITKKTMF